MTSRADCDAAFQQLGYPRFERRPSQDVNGRVRHLERQIDQMADLRKRAELSYLLTNARRCNSMCRDTDVPGVCQNKIQLNFDRAESIEICNQDPYNCFYLIRPVPEMDTIGLEPVHPPTLLYKTLKLSGHQLYSWRELSERFPFLGQRLQIPLEVRTGRPLNHESLRYLASPATLGVLRDMHAEFVPISPGDAAVSSRGRPCQSPCTYQRWGYWPIPRYGCWINRSAGLYDWCEPY